MHVLNMTEIYFNYNYTKCSFYCIFQLFCEREHKLLFDKKRKKYNNRDVPSVTQETF